MERLVDLGPERKNVRLNVRFAGPDGGEPVVLLHGFPEHSWSWRHQILPLQEAGFRVVAPDLRGAGKSDIGGPYELADLADDIRSLIRVLFDDAPAAVVGHDWGGATAWTLARRHPTSVKRLAILNSCLPERQIDALSRRFDVRQFARSWYVYAFQLPWIADHLLAREGGALVKQIIRAGMKDPSAVTDEELGPFAVAATRAGGAGGMLGPYRGAFRRALRDLARSGDPFPERGPIGSKTLLVWGDADPAQGFELIEGMQVVVRDLRIVRMPRCGHFPHSESPEVVNELLLGFLGEG